MSDFLLLADRWAEEQQRLDARTALLAWVMATSFGWKAKGGGELTPADFMPGGTKRSEEQSLAEMEAILMSMVGNNGDK